MIIASYDRNGDTHILSVNGHAGYAHKGEDIVCAAISILTINTINAIDAFTDVKCQVSTNDEQGVIDFRIDNPTKETTLLLDTMVLGLQSMVEDEIYADYIDLKFEEV